MDFSSFLEAGSVPLWIFTFAWIVLAAYVAFERR